MTEQKKVVLELSNAEALVLFEWLKTSEERVDMLNDSSGEETFTATDVVLWKLEAQLEKTLVEPFLANYQELLENARTMVVESATETEEDGQEVP